MLVSRIQCNRLQFRDTHLVETNHDELEDAVGNLYCTASDLNIDLNSSNELLIEGLDESPDNYSSRDRNEALKPIISDDFKGKRLFTNQFMVKLEMTLGC